MHLSERAVVLLVTASTRDQAEKIGEGLLEAGLGSRGSVVPAIHSFWLEAGEVKRGHEAILLFTTTHAHEAEAREFIRRIHSFEEPHVVTLSTGAIS